MDRRPNLVFLVDDQHRSDALGCAGEAGSWLRSGAKVATPNLDELAATGTRFTQAVCNIPVCVASRHSFLTGLRPSQLGILSNSHYFPAEMPVPSLGTVLAAAGYRTASFGKMHWKPGNSPTEHVPDRRGFQVRATNNGERTDGPSDYRFEDVATAEEIAMRRDWKRRFSGGGENHAGYVGEVAPIPSGRFPEAWLAGLAVDFLRDHATHFRDSPFCLMVSVDRPHPENVVPSDYADSYDPAEMPLPPRPPDGFEEQDYFLPRLAARYDWESMTDDEIRTSVARYLTNVTFVDHCFGRVLRELRKLGLEQNTMVVMTADHGELLGERQRSHTKYCLYEAALRVPLIVRWPDGKPGVVSHAPVELIDLMPSWLEASGLPVPEYLPGRSLRPLGEGLSSAQLGWREASVTEHYTPAPNDAAPRTQWAARDGRYKLLERLSGPSALYDLQADPGEFVNRIDDHSFQDQRERLRLLLLRELMRNAEQYPAKSPRFNRVLA